MPVRVGRAQLRVGSAYRALADPLSGGVVIFLGRVRPDRLGRGRVGSLEYEAHIPLAEEALRRLERTARTRFGLRRVLLWHRLGVLGPGEASVLVGVAAPHREEAFRAARYLISELKRSVPIWKTARARSARPRRPRPAPRAAP